jgi:hypothetical protein
MLPPLKIPDPVVLKIAHFLDLSSYEVGAGAYKVMLPYDYAAFYDRLCVTYLVLDTAIS